MRQRAVEVAMGTAAVVALVLLLVALAFLPQAEWERFVPVATVVGGLGVVAAGVVARLALDTLVRPLGSMAHALEEGEMGRNALRSFASQAPEEVALVLYALARTQARLHDTVAELERDRARMATIQAYLADGVVVLDARERVVVSNPAAARLLRVLPLDDRPFAAVVRDPELVEVARAATDLAPVHKLVELQPTAAGARRWVQAIATRLPDREHTLVVLQDVTEFRRVEAARRDFVANVSHELRTPVAALKALVETLEGGALEEPEAGREFLRLMHVEVDRLAQMVSELLDLARVEAGRLDLELEACRATDLVQEAAERIRPYAARVGLTVELADAQGGDARVLADARRIGQTLANLLANAVKFTPPGGQIRLGAREAGAFVEFWVADTGIGIAPEDLSRVFERFYKTDPSRSGAGTGLGLAICKHVVHAHGGTVWAESGGEGRGATFHFTLPRADAERPPALPAPAGTKTTPAVPDEPATERSGPTDQLDGALRARAQRGPRTAKTSTRTTAGSKPAR